MLSLKPYGPVALLLQAARAYYTHSRLVPMWTVSGLKGRAGATRGSWNRFDLDARGGAAAEDVWRKIKADQDMLDWNVRGS